jgi:cation diffusion facilitator CzcD-associated flavoprotein CzcO
MGVTENQRIDTAVTGNLKQPRVIIVGTGLSGVVMGMRLMQAGIRDVTVFEKSHRIGGTWNYNDYPGLRCDVPSHYYQYSFEPSGSWSHRFCGGPEIRQYFEDMAKKYALFQRIRFNKEVTNAEYHDGVWTVETADGVSTTADFLIAACGILVRPKYPDLPGLDTFAGKTVHSARWDHSLDLNGKRVAVIGNGSTGVQMIKPMSDVCAKVVSFQRTPQWIIPVPNRKYSELERTIASKVPGVSTFFYNTYRFLMEQMMGRGIIKDGWSRKMVGKICQWNLNTVKDPVLRQKLTPNYVAMCKRLVMSSEFYPAIQKENVELVTDGIDHIEPAGIVDKTGKLHELDIIALATGFHANEYMLPMTMTGENGMTLADVWKDGPRGYRTVALPGFPNFFMVMGPHSPVGNFSLASIAETQSEYIMNFIKLWQQGKFKAIVPTEVATERFNREMKDNMHSTVWVTGCASWYLDKNGVPGSWPWTATKFRHDLQDPRLEEYRMITA